MRGWGRKNKQKNLSSPETNNQEGCEGTCGEGLTPAQSLGKALSQAQTREPPTPTLSQQTTARPEWTSKWTCFWEAGSCWQRGAGPQGPGQCRAGVDTARAGVQLPLAGSKEETGALPASLWNEGGVIWCPSSGVKMADQRDSLAGQGHFSLISYGLHAWGGKEHGGLTLKG